MSVTTPPALRGTGRYRTLIFIDATCLRPPVANGSHGMRRPVKNLGCRCGDERENTPLKPVDIGENLL